MNQSGVLLIDYGNGGTCILQIYCPSTRTMSVNLCIEIIIAMAKPDWYISTATEVHFMNELYDIITREFEKRQDSVGVCRYGSE